MAYYWNIIQEAGTSKGGFSQSSNRPARNESNLLWWTIAITLLMAMCVFSWFFCIYVFAHPEKPFNYNLLTRLSKIDPLKKFIASKDLPTGDFLTPRAFYNRYYGLSESHTKIQNDLFKQNYILNYKDKSPVYINGKFELCQCRQLTEKDVFQHGMILRCRSLELPNLILELVLPSDKVPTTPFVIGQDIELGATNSCISVIHSERIGDNNLSVTGVSLIYTQWRINNSSAMLVQTPPTHLNMRGHWPILGEPLNASLSSTDNDAGNNTAVANP